MTAASACRACGAKLFGDDIHCPACGARRPDEELASGQTMGATRAFVPRAADAGKISLCRACRAPHHADAKFCTQCGALLAEPARKEPPDAWVEVRQQLEQATTGEFEVVRELGRGGMAAVYVARDLSLGRNVAIKVMAPGLLMGEGMVTRFRQEAVTIANLRHPNIVTIHGVRQAGSLHFFIMQLVEGGSLDDVLKRTGPLPIPLVQVILYQMGTGLAHAHNHGIVHRDIKPANVLLDGDGNVILTDFGIAKAASSTHLTQTGSTLGTPAYMSPEQCLARELSGASDQYSLGIVAYEMLVGHPPFGGSAFEIMQAHTMGTVKGLRDARPDCPAEIEQAVLRMLARDPAQRFPSVAEAIEEVGGYLPGPRDPLRLEIARLVRPDAPAAPAGWKGLTPIPSGRPTPLPFGAAPTPPGAQPAVTPDAPVAAPARTRRKLVTRALAGVVVLAGLGALAAVALRGPRGERTVEETAVPAPSTITFPTPAESLMVRATARVRPLLQDSAGQALPARPLTWSSEDSSIATVTGEGEEGQITAVGPGTTMIHAEAGGVLGKVLVVVTAPPPGALLVSAPSSDLEVGQEVQLSVQDPGGQPLTATGVRWTSSDPRVVAVDAARAVAIGRGVGRARVTAASEGRSGTFAFRVAGQVQAVTVAQPGASPEAGRTVVLRASVTAQPAGYRGVNGLIWSSSSPDVAAVSGSADDSAVISLLRDGEATLTASADAARGSVTLRVRPAPPAASISLAPGSVELDLTEGAAASADRTVRVNTTGGADAVLGVVRYEGSARDWLRTSLADAGQGAVLTVRADGSGLSAGSYQAVLPVGTGPVKQELSVRLTVAPRPAATAVEASAAAEREIGDLLTAYVAAINARNEARVREVYPSIPATAIRDLMRIQSSDIFQVLPLPGTLRPGRQERTFDIDVSAGIIPRTGAGQTRRMTYTVARNARGWYIMGMRAGG